VTGRPEGDPISRLFANARIPVAAGCDDLGRVDDDALDGQVVEVEAVAATALASLELGPKAP